MRLHIPDHLQKEFHTLMSLSYELKKKYPGLKRNIKFDEEDGGLFMDIKLNPDAEWKRIKPREAEKRIKVKKGKTKTMDEEELRSLFSGGSDSD